MAQNDQSNDFSSRPLSAPAQRRSRSSSPFRAMEIMRCAITSCTIFGWSVSCIRLIAQSYARQSVLTISGSKAASRKSFATLDKKPALYQSCQEVAVLVQAIRHCSHALCRSASSLAVW
jgi:hypothetical protein